MGDPWRRGTWTKRGDGSYLASDRGIPGHFHLEHRAVDGARIDVAFQDHLNRVLMGTGLDHAAEVAAPESARGEVISDQVITGVRSRLVVGPRCTPQVFERAE